MHIFVSSLGFPAPWLREVSEAMQGVVVMSCCCAANVLKTLSMIVNMLLQMKECHGMQEKTNTIKRRQSKIKSGKIVTSKKTPTNKMTANIMTLVLHVC